MRAASNFPKAYIINSFADLCFTTYLISEIFLHLPIVSQLRFADTPHLSHTGSSALVHSINLAITQSDAAQGNTVPPTLVCSGKTLTTGPGYTWTSTTWPTGWSVHPLAQLTSLLGSVWGKRFLIISTFKTSNAYNPS